MRTVYRAFPDPAATSAELTETGLTEDQVIAAYAPPDRGTPMIRANMISSLDGAATLGGRSGALGTPVDQALLGYLRRHADVVLVGANTVRVEGYRGVLLDTSGRQWRARNGLSEHPRLAVVSRSLDLPDRIFANSPEPVILITDEQAPDRWSDVAQVIRCGRDHVDLVAARDALAARGLIQVLTEGGPHLLGELAAADLLDEVCLTVSPLLVGPGPARIVAGPPDRPRPLTLLHALLDADLLFLRYRTGVLS